MAAAGKLAFIAFDFKSRLATCYAICVHMTVKKEQFVGFCFERKRYP